MTLWYSLIGCLFLALAQPRLIQESPKSYLPGDVIDSELFVVDGDLERRPLLDLIKPESEVVVLILFGGAALKAPETAFRGEFWCEDSFDDLAIQRALVAEFDTPRVQFVAVAVPPVFSPKRYGFPADVFFKKPEGDRSYRKALRLFIEKTERLKESTLLPFSEVFYDSKARLTQDRESASLDSDYGPVYDWQGKLKWHLDPRKYGAPTLWILDGKGRILQEPFWGNDYDSEPPQVNYGFGELRAAVKAALGDE